MKEKFVSLGLDSKFKKTKLNKLEKDTISRIGLSENDIDEMLSGEPFAEGSYAMVFDVPKNKDMVAKVWKNSNVDSHRADHENAALRLLRFKKTEGVPGITGYTKSSPMIFEKKIEGLPIKKVDDTIVKQLADALSKIHSIKLNSYGKPLAERKSGTKYDYLKDGINILRNNLSSLTITEEISSFIDKIIIKIENQAENNKDAFDKRDFTLIHFDLNYNNILKKSNDGKLVIIDWEQASAGDNAMDLAKMFFKLDFNESQKKQFLSRYEKELEKKDDSLQDRLKIYQPLVILNSLLWRIQILNSQEEKFSNSKYDQDFYKRVGLGYDNDINKLKDYYNNTLNL